MPERSDRARAVLIAAVAAICLISAKPPQMVGDSGEYLVYSLNFASLRGPSLRTRDLPELKRQVVEYAPALDEDTFYRNAVAGRDGRRDFMHFWFFSLVATPFVWIAEAVRLPPVYGFVGLNLSVWLLAIWVAFPRLGGAACALIFASPIVWWLDKPHTEVFTFGLLAIAMLLIREKPWWAMIAAGLASTQYPHIAALVAAIGGVVGVARVMAARRMSAIVDDRRLIAGAAIAVALAVLHPAYYYVRHGTPSLLLNVANSGMPTRAELSAVLLDPEIGLFANFPLFPILALIAVIAAVRRGWRTLTDADLVVSVMIGGLFLFVTGQKDNVHHGGTPGMSRYALWFIAVAIPWLRAGGWIAGRVSAWRWTAAAASAIACVFAFHPSLPQNSREPTWAAQYLWTRHPAWNNPLPEVFTETFGNTEDPLAPTWTDGCEKVLIGGTGGPGEWPVPCYPANLPPECRTNTAWCYANRSTSGYEFAPAPGRWNRRPMLQPSLTWPAEAEASVRRIYDQWQWQGLRADAPIPGLLRSSRNVHVLMLESADRFIAVLRNPGSDAALVFRLPHAMSGALTDPRTGQTVAALRFDGQALDRWEVAIPSSPSLILLAMR